MAIKLRKAQDNSARKINMAVMGRSGVGKTFMLSTTSKSILMLNTDKGELSLQGAKNKIDIFDAKNIEDLQQFIEFIETEEAIKKYDIIAIDSASVISKLLMAHSKETEKNKFDVYPNYRKLFEGFLKRIRDNVNYHTYTIFELGFVENENGERIFVPNTDWNKYSQQVEYLYDEVLVLHREGDKRKLQTGPANGFTAKDRSGKLEMLEEPHLDNILTKILGE